MELLEIAICDDTEEECREVEAYAARFFEERGIDVRIDTYAAMGGLLASNTAYDLYLLDVLMPGMTGIEGAARLKERAEHPVVVFITSSLEAAVDGYSVNAAGFVLKPVQWEHFCATLERVLSEQLKERHAYLTVTHNRVPVKLKLDRVAFLENRLHRVYVTLLGGETLAVSHKLSELQDELKADARFLRCHQSYIVNLDCVEALDESCFQMADGQMVPVSRNFYKQSKHAYYHHRLK